MAHFLELLAKSVARGGNVLLNVGPMGDGRLDPKDLQILDGMAAWMKNNRPSIAGTSRTPLPVQAWGETTRRGNTLYLHVLNPPRGQRLVLGGLRTPVKAVSLLGAGAGKKLPFERLGDLDVAITLPPRPGAAGHPVLVVETEGEPTGDPARLLGTDVAVDTLRAFDGERVGDLAFGSGKTRDAWVRNWTRPDQAMRWSMRLREPASFAVSISYDAPAEAAGGTFAVKLGEGKALTGTVSETPDGPVALGRVTLPAGAFTISVEATSIKGPELFRLRALRLTPVDLREGPPRAATRTGSGPRRR